MELAFLVVEAVQDVLDVRDLTQLRAEIVQQALIEDLDAAQALVDGFDLFEDEAFFDFLEVEHQFEQFRVFEVQEVLETLNLIDSADVAIGFEVVVELFV